MSEPRQHHILPEFYLAGFSDDGSRQGMVHVYDYVRGRLYRGKPAGVARQRDFYRIHEPGEDPNSVEKEFAELEGDYARALERVTATRRVNSPSELGVILSFAALLHARGRRARWRLSEALTESMARKLREGEVTKEQYDHVVASEVRAGLPQGMFPSFEAVRAYLALGWAPKAPEILKVGFIPWVQQVIIDALVSRIWSIGVASPDSGGYITSDTPLVWGDKQPSDPDAGLERIDDPATRVTFPLNSQLALITRNDRQGTYQAARAVVALVNSRTFFHSMGTAYWIGGVFLLARANGQIGSSSDFFAYVEEARRNGVEWP